MNATQYREKPFVKTKIIATVGPASATRDVLAELILAGVDVFRFNFAHGSHEWLHEMQGLIRDVAAEIGTMVGILGDLAGPKIRLGELQNDEIECQLDEQFRFVRDSKQAGSHDLTCTYEGLIDDLRVDDRVVMADGTVQMRVVKADPDGEGVECVVEVPGIIRSRQGLHAPGVTLNTPILSDKDRDDLGWALEHGLDFIGLSFVRSAADVRELRADIDAHPSGAKPLIVAKIETVQAIQYIDEIIAETDAVMVARGDLGVETDIARLPTLQKEIIHKCNQSRIPVITATQMLDSMERTELPTRAEVNDVANAVWDGSDAVMLSGETAIGVHPAKAAAMMSRIIRESEPLVHGRSAFNTDTGDRARALDVTEAVAWGAGRAAEQLDADLVVVATHTGKTALAVSNQRMATPIFALTDNPETARRMCLYWGVTPHHTDAVHLPAGEFLNYVAQWGRDHHVLATGSKLVLVYTTDWSTAEHDMMLIHQVP